ncbi:MAG: DUF72 domain-containing protein [Planctomycetota bacterium]
MPSEFPLPPRAATAVAALFPPPAVPAAPAAEPGAPALYVGASGYAYPEWVEAGFYPPGTKQAQMLPLYLQQFGAVELNYTWYQMPKADAVERQRRQTPPAFRFAAKLTRTLTHEVTADWRKQAAAYREGIAPLVEARQLAAVLIQLAPDFTYTVPSRRYLAALLQALRDLPLAVEFRHVSWAQPRVYTELARRRVVLVSVDAPPLPALFPPTVELTHPDWFYARFHGRNARGWQSGQAEQKFHYDYSDAELADSLERRIAPLHSQAPTGYVFFNNHYGGLAPKNALRFKTLARKFGLQPR